jgi:hypothetical protein
VGLSSAFAIANGQSFGFKPAFEVRTLEPNLSPVATGNIQFQPDVLKVDRFGQLMTIGNTQVSQTQVHGALNWTRQPDAANFQKTFDHIAGIVNQPRNVITTPEGTTGAP